VPRKRPAAVLLLLAAVVLLAACGGDAASSDPGATRTVTDGAGRSQVLPAAPQRVVALSEPTLDGMLALGLRPVATTGGRGQGGVPGYLGERARSIPVVGLLGRPVLEKVAALRPDLILIDGTSTQDGAVIAKLRRIAPVLEVARAGSDWRASFTRLAGALGQAARGRRVLAAYDARVRAIRARLGANAGARISLVRWSGIGLPALLLRELAASRVLADLGLRRPAAQDREGPGHSVPVSLERLDAIDGDWIFLGALGTGATGGVADTPADVRAARAALRTARDTPGFGALRAVRAGHVVPVDGSAWTSAGGPLAAGVVLDDVQRELTRP
jgi:iron complex transport system substrate-binding protein